MPRCISDVSIEALRHLDKIQERVQNLVNLRSNSSCRRSFLIEVALLGEWLTYLRDASNPCIQKLQQSSLSDQPFLWRVIGLRNISLKQCYYEQYLYERQFLRNCEKLEEIIEFFDTNNDTIKFLREELQTLSSHTEHLNRKQACQERRSKVGDPPTRRVMHEIYEFTPADFLLMIKSEVFGLWAYIHDVMPKKEEREDIEGLCSQLKSNQCNKSEIITLQSKWDEIIKRELSSNVDNLKIVCSYTINIAQILKDLRSSMEKSLGMVEFNIVVAIREWTKGDNNATGVIAKMMGLDGTRGGTHFIDMLIQNNIENISETTIDFSGIVGACIIGLDYLKRQGITPNYFEKQEKEITSNARSQRQFFSTS